MCVLFSTFHYFGCCHCEHLCHTFVWAYIFSYFGSIPRVEMLDYMVTLFNIWRNCQNNSKVAAPFYTLIRNGEVSNFSMSLSTLVIVCIFVYSQPSGSELLSYMVLSCINFISIREQHVLEGLWFRRGESLEKGELVICEDIFWIWMWWSENMLLAWGWELSWE